MSHANARGAGRENRWADDDVVEEVARDLANQYGVDRALEIVKAQCTDARDRGDTIGSEAWGDIRDAVRRLRN
jgi:hypothetical protein